MRHGLHHGHIRKFDLLKYLVSHKLSHGSFQNGVITSYLLGSGLEELEP